MERVPFRFIEGCLIAAHAIECKHVYVYIRGEYDRPFDVLMDSLEEMRTHGGLLDEVTIVIHRGAGAYICGEETALLESLEGERGQPRTKPPFPAIAGLYASPTAVNNVESIATVVPILEMGAKKYAKIGVENSTGTRVFSLSGTVVNGGNYEVESGTTLRHLIYELGGGIPNGRELKAICPGGLSAPLLTADQVDTGLDISSLAAPAAPSAPPAVIVLDDRCCIVEYGFARPASTSTSRAASAHPAASARAGSRSSSRRSRTGDGTEADLDLLLDVCDRVNGKCLCPLGDSDALGGRELLREVRGRVPCSRGARRLPVRRLAARRGARTGRDARAARHAPHARGARVSAASSSPSRWTTARCRCRRASASSRRPPRRGSRSRSSATSRGSGRPSAPAACASSRWRGCRSCRPGARSRPRRAWSSRRPHLASAPPRARTPHSSSSSSTIRSTARSATRAANARCRT